jgi:hypothetical protein
MIFRPFGASFLPFNSCASTAQPQLNRFTSLFAPIFLLSAGRLSLKGVATSEMVPAGGIEPPA